MTNDPDKRKEKIPSDEAVRIVVGYLPEMGLSVPLINNDSYLDVFDSLTLKGASVSDALDKKELVDRN